MSAQEIDIIKSVTRGFGKTFQVDEPGRYIIDEFELSAPYHAENDSGKWEVYVVTVIPGVWRTANGDGWPDDADVSLHGSYDKLEDALRAIGELHVAAVIDSTMQSVAMQAMFEEMTDVGGQA